MGTPASHISLQALDEQSTRLTVYVRQGGTGDALSAASVPLSLERLEALERDLEREIARLRKHRKPSAP